MRTLAFVLSLIAAVLSQGGCASSQQDRYTFEPAFAVEDAQFRRSLGNLGESLVGGNSATLLENGDGIFPVMLEDIRRARSSVNLETYIYKDDEVGRRFADAMIGARRRGVEVRLLTDAQGSDLGPLRKRLEEGGVRCRNYRPANRYPFYGRRTHRKLLIVDGTTAYTGGFCFDERWLGDARDKTEWRDSAVRVSGPVVAQLQSIFAENWTFTTGEILAGDAFYPKPAASGAAEAQAFRSSKGEAASLPKMLYFTAIQAARRSIRIQNAYFLPDTQLREALIAAARRGVDVRVMVPGAHIDVPPIRPASRRHFGDLLQGGVRIHEYQPAMLHSKTLVVDGLFASIGSINLDGRSMSKNAEVSLNFYDRQVSRSFEAMFEKDLERCREITYDAWKHRGLGARLAEFFSGPFKPLY